MWTAKALGLLASVLVFGFGMPFPTAAQDDFEGPPIEYSKAVPDNAVSRLQQRLNRGDTVLTHDEAHGYLRSVLQALQLPISSQSLVFSRTSLQLRRISPETPRALYFNDTVYLGFCQGGDVLELSVADPVLGTVFYTLDQQPASDVPQFQRQTDNCLVCHSSSRTDGVPGHLIRSLMVESSGQPLLSAGSRNVNHLTPLEERWGGWYVTGLHGSQKHLGNLISHRDAVNDPVDNSQGLNLTRLDDRFRVERYLSSHSDIVALMVLEHQILVHNRITRAAFTTREALHYEAALNEALKNAPGSRLDSTTRRIQNAGDRLVEALLFCGEARISEPISGTSGFAAEFSAQGPRDAQGRSLRDLQLNGRMFRYPCSYLIYSEAFRSLPAEMLTYVRGRMREILAGNDTSGKFTHLSADDRQAITEILQGTDSVL
jgi:hypothetical protein